MRIIKLSIARLTACIKGYKRVRKENICSDMRKIIKRKIKKYRSNLPENITNTPIIYSRGKTFKYKVIGKTWIPRYSNGKNGFCGDLKGETEYYRKLK